MDKVSVHTLEPVRRQGEWIYAGNVMRGFPPLRVYDVSILSMALHEIEGNLRLEALLGHYTGGERCSSP